MRRRFDIEFSDGTPFLLKALGVLLFLNFAVSYAIGFWVRNSWPKQATSSCSYQLRFMGGASVFVPPALGYHIDGSFWGHFVLVALLFLVVIVYVLMGGAEIGWRR